MPAAAGTFGADAASADVGTRRNSSAWRWFRFPLSFADTQLEEAFLREYRADAVQVVRWGCGLALVFVLAFMWQDNEISATGYRATKIRTYLATPLCLLTWYVLGLAAAHRYVEVITSLFLLVYVGLTAAIFLVFEPGFYGLSGPIAAGNFLLIVLATFTLSYLRFVWALLVGIGVLLIYWISVISWTNFDFDEFVYGHVANGIMAYVVGAVTSAMFEILRRRQFKIAQALSREKERYKLLLYTLVPSSIASRIEAGEFPIADSHAEVAILFADIVGFTELTRQLAPRTLIQLLNELFFEFDQAAERHRIEKIKTIGDGYMAACGLPVAEEQRTVAIAQFALEMVAIAKLVAERHDLPVGIRVGIHTGGLIAGVIGKSRYMYDMWGESVNMASRMESSGVVNRVQISESAYQRLKRRVPCEPRGEIAVKGLGTVSTYLLAEPIPDRASLDVATLPGLPDASAA